MRNIRKALSLFLAVVMLAALSTSVFAGPSNLNSQTPWKTINDLAPNALAPMFGDTYPYSVDYDWPACKSDPVLTGTVIAGVGANGITHCWADGTDNASCAFDGDTTTFFDPYEASDRSWVGLRVDMPYELTEVRICNRSGQEDRIIGAAVQGSNDNGLTWHTIVYFDPALYGMKALLFNDYHIVTPQKNYEYTGYYMDCFGMDRETADFSRFWVGGGAYSMFRYVSLGGFGLAEVSHGDVAEIELYGHPAKPETASGQTPGQVIGQVLSTDIRAYINGAEIPAYNIDGKLAILVSDLNNYGFRTSFSNSLRMTAVTRDRSASKFQSVSSKASGLPIGAPVMSVFSTDITVELDGKAVPAFNVDNRMAIYFSELMPYGDYGYDNSLRASLLVLK